MFLADGRERGNCGPGEPTALRAAAVRLLSTVMTSSLPLRVLCVVAWLALGCGSQAGGGAAETSPDDGPDAASDASGDFLPDAAPDPPPDQPGDARDAPADPSPPDATDADLAEVRTDVADEVADDPGDAAADDAVGDGEATLDSDDAADDGQDVADDGSDLCGPRTPLPPDGPYVRVGVGFGGYQYVDNCAEVDIISGIQGGHHIWGAFEAGGFDATVDDQFNIDFEFRHGDEVVAEAHYVDVIRRLDDPDGGPYHYDSVTVIFHDDLVPEEQLGIPGTMHLHLYKDGGVDLTDDVVLIPTAISY
jgi:hypothetical protein